MKGLIRKLPCSFIGIKRRNEAGCKKDFDVCAGFLVSRSDNLILNLLNTDENICIKVGNKLEKLLDDEGKDYLKSDEAEINKRKRKDKTKDPESKKDKNYKNANELL